VISWAFRVTPSTTNLDGVKVMNKTKYTVELYARTMPPELTVQVTVWWRQVDMTPTTAIGMTTYHEFVGSAAFDPAPTVLGSNWTHITLDVSAVDWPAVGGTDQVSLNLRLATHAWVGRGARFAAGEIWIDDVSMRNLTAVTAGGGKPL
jgi:hypothetical protein